MMEDIKCDTIKSKVAEAANSVAIKSEVAAVNSDTIKSKLRPRPRIKRSYSPVQDGENGAEHRAKFRYGIGKRKIKTEAEEEATNPEEVNGEGGGEGWSELLEDFHKGTNNKGGLCLWNEGYRYIRRKGDYWKCSKRHCPATAKIVAQDDAMKGKMGSEPHNHPAEPLRQEAEERRAAIKEKIRQQPDVKRSIVLTEILETVPKEVFAVMGNDKALLRMAFREQRKLQENDEEYIAQRKKKIKVKMENAEGMEEEGEDKPRLVEFHQGTTNKGGTCLWNEGYRYVTRSKNGRYWKCSKKGCPATAKTFLPEDGVIRGYIGGVEPHNHPAEPQKLDAEERRNSIKRKIKEQPHLEQSRLLTEARAEATDEVFAAMGNDKALRQMAFRAKYKLFGKINTRNPLKIVFTDDQMKKDGSNLLIYDSREVRQNQKDVVLVFSHPMLLDILRNHRRWGVDGNYKTVPKPFARCFVVGAFVNAHKIPICMYALLPGKHKKYYVEALTALRRAIHPVNPYRFISDYDMSLISAIKDLYPIARLNGCMYRQSQALYKRWCELGLEATLEDEHFFEAYRMILSLPLLPTFHIRRAFSIIIDSSPAEIADFLFFFAEEYIGFTEVELQLGVTAFKPGTVIREWRTVSNANAMEPGPSSAYGQTAHSSPPATAEFDVHRWELPIVRPPRFSIEFWNLNDQAMNALEASHLQFMDGIKQPHSTMAGFIHALHDDVDKQVEIARSVVQFSEKHHHQFAMQEQDIMTLLLSANYADDAGLHHLMSSLGLQVDDYVSSLREKTADLEEPLEPGTSLLTEQDTLDVEEEEELLDETF